MCIFAGSIKSVSRTNIFTRIEDDWQVLIYEMSIDTPKENAMVLPIPIDLGQRQNGVKFYDLSKYENLFRDLKMLFPRDAPLPRGSSRGFLSLGGNELKVESIGSFEASFVPEVKDFRRLDSRFSLSQSILQSLPEYNDYSFIVFKLKKGKFKVHPMALKFKTRNPNILYFPTVHVHDGKVRNKEKFNHVLFTQGEVKFNNGWERSFDKLISSTHKDLNEKSKGLIDLNTEVYRKVMKGEFLNKDQFLEL